MLGFACKINKSHDYQDETMAIKSTTLTWLKNNPSKAEHKLEALLTNNLDALFRQVKWVAARPAHLRMFRISSDLLPAYSHDDFMPFYFSQNTQLYLEKHLSQIGEFARSKGVRLSFHPGQFCVLASENPQIVENSIVEFEYHADIIRYMGYGQKFQDFKCNVHIGGKLGPDGIRKAFKRLSREAQNTLTIENAEFSWGIEHSLELADLCALVLDVHHHWIYQNEYISADSDVISRVIESWRGVRPVIHYSQSRVLEELDYQGMTSVPDSGFTKMKLRAHSDYYYNSALNDWTLQHYAWADIMCEAKEKNLAVDKLAIEWGL